MLCWYEVTSMNEYNTDKKYKPFKIPDRQKAQESGVSKVQPQNRHYTQMSLSDGLFYEIEYDKHISLLQFINMVYNVCK